MIMKENEIQLRNLLDNIRWIREYYCIPQKRMAQLLGIGVRSLKTLEKGILPPRLGINIVFQLHKEFRYSVSNLFAFRLPYSTGKGGKQ